MHGSGPTVDWRSLVGVVTLAAGLGGYALGLVAAYPGRALSVPATMLGLTLVAIARPGSPIASSEGSS